MLEPSRGRYDVEIRAALAEGILAREEADALVEDARRLGKSPVALLVERGRLTEESLASIARAIGAGAPPSLADASADPARALDEAATGARPDRGAAAPTFPAPAWDRYECLRFLGQGGMGRVFLARDRRLRRDVAIKLVRGDDPRKAKRLVSEARAQARIDDDRVCKVYEVGEIEGEVYIAMQYLAGEPLGALARALTAEQKAMVLRDAARGVHEAHRAGIIHRDIKPSNIMVDRTEDGVIRTHVLDFGLARAPSEGETETGAILGTPQYMPPEQARGEVRTLDRRADVYSLGATLYHLLTDEPPIPGGNALEVLNNVALVEPRPPRALNPDIPADLEAIARKCLEKDRSDRYDSARALAEDLERFLCGEPVRARPGGIAYRARRWVARRRRVVAAASAAIAVVLVALGLAIKARGEAVERERLARRFTELAERIEAMARYSALSPLHDIRGDRAAIRARMDELEGEMKRAGPIALGPGSYALGRGYLALDDDAKARERLEAAWEHGFHEPRAAYALALVMGHLYQRDLLDAERIRDEAPREARKREIERRYRDPALTYLRLSEGAEVPSTAYVAALIAFYEDRLDEALAHVDAIGGGLPWFYEGPELRGDILLARGLRARNRGDRDHARSDLDGGRKAYTAAAAVGESVPAVHEALGELEYEALVTELYGHGDVGPPFARGVEAAGRALAAMPDLYPALVLTARLHRSLGEQRANQGANVEDLLAKAIAAAERATAIAPERSEARLEIARSHRQWGEDLLNHNQDPREQLRRAVEVSEAIGAEGRDYDYYSNLGLVFKIWADYEDDHGGDARENRKKAIDAYARAIERNARLPGVFINLGINYFKRASQPHAEDPDGDLARAVSALEKARSNDPKHIVALFYEGQIHELSARRERARGGDAAAAWARALEAYQEGVAINPRLPHLRNGVGTVLLEQARDTWDHGGDPMPLIDRARAAFEEAAAVAPEQGFGDNNVGEALALRATFERARGVDPGASARAAVEALRRAAARIPDEPTPWANIGLVHRIVAEDEIDRGRDPRASLDRAAEAIDKALRLGPKDPKVRLYLAETRGARARWKAARGEAAGADFEDAARAFQEAIDLAPDDQDAQIAFGEILRGWASAQRKAGIDAGPTLARGLALVDPILSKRPGWPDALVLRASLSLAKAEDETSSEGSRAFGRRAREDFESALRANPNLERRFRDQAVRAELLAKP